MASTAARTPRERRVPRPDTDLRPYFFRRDASDVLDETFTALFASRDRAPEAGHTSPRSVIEEQRRTLFASDEFLQRLFDGDYEAFSAAVDHPEQFHDRLTRRLRRPSPPSDDHTPWSDLDAPVRAWEDHHDHAEETHAHHHEHHEDLLEDDPVYDRAFRWACRIDRWGRRLAATLQQPNYDLTRILGNAVLVSAKIAFGFSAAMDDDVPGFEIAVVGYHQAAIFLHRVLESLGACYGKRIGRPQTVHDLLDEGRDLLADIESRTAEYESEIRYRRGKKS